MRAELRVKRHVVCNIINFNYETEPKNHNDAIARSIPKDILKTIETDKKNQNHNEHENNNKKNNYNNYNNMVITV